MGLIYYFKLLQNTQKRIQTGSKTFKKQDQTGFEKPPLFGFPVLEGQVLPPRDLAMSHDHSGGKPWVLGAQNNGKKTRRNGTSDGLAES